MFSTLFFYILILFIENKSFDPRRGCHLINYATLVFTAFETSKDPTFAQSLTESFGTSLLEFKIKELY